MLLLILIFADADTPLLRHALMPLPCLMPARSADMALIRCACASSVYAAALMRAAYAASAMMLLIAADTAPLPLRYDIRRRYADD